MTGPTISDLPVLIGIEIITRRKYSIHARNEETALEMIQLFEQDQNPTVVNCRSCGGSIAMAINRTQSSIERILLDDIGGAVPASKDSPDALGGDPVQELFDAFQSLSREQQHAAFDRLNELTLDTGEP